MDERVMEFVNALVGRQLISLCCEAEILDFGFGELVLHGISSSIWASFRLSVRFYKKRLRGAWGVPG